VVFGNLAIVRMFSSAVNPQFRGDARAVSSAIKGLDEVTDIEQTHRRADIVPDLE